MLLLALTLVVGISSSYNHNLDYYLHEFETLAKEHIYIEHVSNFDIPSALKLYVRIQLSGKEFHATLQPHLDLFHPELIVRQRQAKGQILDYVDVNEFLEGTLLDDPNSRVLVHIRDSIVSGSIQTADGETYFIEPSSRHISEPHDFHMISYKLSDVKFNLTRANKGHFCGHESHKETGSSDKLFDFMIPKNVKVNDDDSMQYFRRKRSTTTKKSCPLALIADYVFYKNIAGKEAANAYNYMIGLIQQIDPIYQGQSLDSSGSSAYEGYGFQIKYLEVITDSNVLTAEADSDSYKYYVDGHLPDVSDLLSNFAYGDWEDYCLAHLFTNYDFADGVLGLAYVASSSTSSVGGICTKTYTDGTGQRKDTNVGLSSTVNYGRTLLTSELVFVTGHELGHNWGSSHDSDSSEECAPENNYYMMYPSAVDGSQSNNQFFSPCSKQAINEVLNAKSDRCFVEAATSFCGNGVVEGTEECDPGAEDTTCCQSCSLTAGSECSDANTDCCRNCLFTGSEHICLETKWESGTSNYCTKDYTCNGAGSCVAGEKLDDGSSCYDGGSCKDGTCTKFCEYRGKVTCSCTEYDDSCKQCCKDSDDSSCEVHYDTSNSYTNLTDGKICATGICVGGLCEAVAQDIQEKFWEIIDEITISSVAQWFNNNIVFAVILFTSIIWIPVSVFVDWLDDKYDLGIVDDILGSSSDEKKVNQRGILLGSTEPADTSTNVYPKLGSTLAGSNV